MLKRDWMWWKVEGQGTYRIAVRGLIMDGDRFLLMKRSKISRGEYGFWELPGGGQDFGESPEEALHREVEEEAKMKIEVKKPLSVWHYLRDENVQIIGFTFLCQAKDINVTMSDEHLDYAWVKFEDIDNYKIFPELKEEMKKWDIF